MHALNYCDRVRLLWDYIIQVTARISLKQLEQLDVVDSVDLPWTGVKRVVILAD